MKIGILAPVAWRTPPRQYGPWEQVASNVAEGMARAGHEVTLFATADSETAGTLRAVVARGYAEDGSVDPKVCEYLHIGAAMEYARELDVLHNHFDFMPLSFAPHLPVPMVTTIHGFSSEQIVPIYQRYNKHSHYVSISNADRHVSLSYAATVYNGIDPQYFTLNESPEDYLLYFGRIHPHKGAKKAIAIAQQTHRRLIIAGLIQEQGYYDEHVAPHVDGEHITYVGNVGPTERDQLLGNAAALLHPISFAEPFGLSVAESMFCGTPVIAFALGAMPELIQDGKTGFLVNNVAEAVDRVGELSQLDRAYCRAHAEANFSVERMVAGYAAVYASIVQ